MKPNRMMRRQAERMNRRLNGRKSGKPKETDLHSSSFNKYIPRERVFPLCLFDILDRDFLPFWIADLNDMDVTKYFNLPANERVEYIRNVCNGSISSVYDKSTTLEVEKAIVDLWNKKFPDPSKSLASVNGFEEGKYHPYITIRHWLRISNRILDDLYEDEHLLKETTLTNFTCIPCSDDDWSHFEEWGRFQYCFWDELEETQEGLTWKHTPKGGDEI